MRYDWYKQILLQRLLAYEFDLGKLYTIIRLIDILDGRLQNSQMEFALLFFQCHYKDNWVADADETQNYASHWAM